MPYGYFDDQQREYVITDPRTPVKWINYVGSLNFGGLVDHTGGVLICRQDPALNRITKYIPQLPAGDFRGSTLYLRIQTEAGYRVFSPFFTPTLDPYDRYECHVGMGYTRIVSEFYGLRTEATFFVPADDECLLTDIRVSNLGDQALVVDAIPVVEYSHFNALQQFTNADWVPQTMQSETLESEGGRKYLLQYAFMHKGLRVNYFTASLPASSYDTERRIFLGANEYSGWARPLSLQQAELNNSVALRGDNMAAMMLHLGTLAPGAEQRFVTQLGQDGSAAIPDRAARYWDLSAVDAAFSALKTYWDDYLNTVQVETPDASMNSMLNVHHPRQCHTTKNWSRFLSLYQLGLGSRGIGFRDSSQDVMAVMLHMADEGRALIEKLLSVQNRNGSAMHLFYPLTMEASRGDFVERPDAPHYYSDDHLWSVLAVCAYLKATGDFAFLEQRLPYYDKDAVGATIEAGSVWDHMQRGIEFTHSHTGAHGLPLLGFADWNDTVNLRTGAELLFTASLYGRALLELIDLTEHLGQVDLQQHFSAYYQPMSEIVNQQGWDGAWYRRYYDADGSPIGSQQNQTGKIFANAQSWPVLAGFATPERALTALDSVFTHLNTASGIKLSTPGFNGFDPALGGVSTYPPGAKENGGIFLHANPWVIIAETLTGRGDRAFQYYKQINPAAKNERIDEFEVEPYVYPQNILGDEHPQFGLGRNSWLSGTASWMYQAAIQYILGVRPTYQGLKIDPCIPKDWSGFKLRLRFRQASYQIDVQNPNAVNKGVRSIIVDGRALAGDEVPVFADHQNHEVQVVMGLS